MSSYPTLAAPAKRTRRKRLRTRIGKNHATYHNLLAEGWLPFCDFCGKPLVCCDRVPGDQHTRQPYKDSWRPPEGSGLFMIATNVYGVQVPSCVACKNSRRRKRNRRRT